MLDLGANSIATRDVSSPGRTSDRPAQENRSEGLVKPSGGPLTRAEALQRLLVNKGVNRHAGPQPPRLEAGGQPPAPKTAVRSAGPAPYRTESKLKARGTPGGHNPPGA